MELRPAPTPSGVCMKAACLAPSLANERKHRGRLGRLFLFGEPPDRVRAGRPAVERTALQIPCCLQENRPRDAHEGTPRMRLANKDSPSAENDDRGVVLDIVRRTAERRGPTPIARH